MSGDRRWNLYGTSEAQTALSRQNEERAVASLFSPGGTHALKGEFAGINEFEC
jgi:hypothetical protein